MQKNSLRQRIQRKVKWCHKMEKKLAVIVDNKKVTTEAENIELCSSACDVAMETCSSQSHDTCGERLLTLEEMPILSGFVACFEGNISTK